MRTSTSDTGHAARSTGGTQVNRWLTVILLVLICILLYRQLMWQSSLFTPSAEPRLVTPRGELGADETATIELFQNVAPSVVHITSVAVQRNVFTMDHRQLPAGSGSGFIWDQAGHIVTNLHVVRDAQGAIVTLADNSNYPARLVGFDAFNDLAVLKINAPADRLVPITIGESSRLSVGQRVFAIGSPFEFDHTLTTGIISGLNRTIQTDSARIHGAIQTDAAINPGNSGGPLLDSAGRLIGVNTAIVSGSGGSDGIGFAIPADLVNLAVPDLIRDGSISRPWLGVVVRENVVLGPVRLPGLLVEHVVPDGPAARAGIIPIHRGPNSNIVLGDQILAINDTLVETSRELLEVLSRHRAGDTIKVTLLRNSDTADVQVQLEDMPAK